MSDPFIPPYGGTAVDLERTGADADILRETAHACPSLRLDHRRLRDLELLANGAFAPIRGFMTRDDVTAVVATMRLMDGTWWPLPIVLPLPSEVAEALGETGRLALCDPEGVPLGVLHEAEIWRADADLSAEIARLAIDRSGSATESHFEPDSTFVSGRVEIFAPPTHRDFARYRSTPAETRRAMARLGWTDAVALHTRRPLHRGDVALADREAGDRGVLVQALTQPPEMTDLRHYPAVRALAAAVEEFPAGRALLGILPLAGAAGSARHRLLRAIVARNHGCCALLGVADGQGVSEDGIDDAAREIGVDIRPLPRSLYLPGEDRFIAEDEAVRGREAIAFEDEDLAERLRTGAVIPEWFSWPMVLEEMRAIYPPRDRQGFTVFMTGLSGSGKSTVAKLLFVRLMEMGGRSVTLLDGDIVRRRLSSGLGFSREDRDINVRRIGFVASEITRAGGVAICAPIAPYEQTRRDVRGLVESCGGFVLVHVATPIETCERRDRKGLYAKARAGLIREFTGVSDPYEPPDDAEISIDTTNRTPQESVSEVLDFLADRGYVTRPARDGDGTRTG